MSNAQGLNLGSANIAPFDCRQANFCGNADPVFVPLCSNPKSFEISVISIGSGSGQFAVKPELIAGETAYWELPYGSPAVANGQTMTSDFSTVTVVKLLVVSAGGCFDTHSIPVESQRLN
jgi:hypothetical protein